MHDATKDGIEHINVYGAGKTELGRLLSNLTRTPFTLKEQGPFQCVEGWWYWQSLYCQNKITGAAAELRDLWGHRCKMLGRKLHLDRRLMTIAPTRFTLMVVYREKALQNPEVKRLLQENKLPFDHYYVYNGKCTPTKWRWTGIIWKDVVAML
jgi:hypothetical protein